MSDISRTTVGGVDYDDLLRGSRNYACNPVIKLTTETEVEEIKTKLIAQLEQTITDLESGEFLSDRTIAKVYIGKTYLEQKRKPGRGIGFQKFDPDDHRTWKKNGISSRWQDHKKEKKNTDGTVLYGRDGLVVLGAITRETVLNTCRGRVHQEDFALAMEQKLLHHYLLSRSDPRVPVVNETFTTGRTTKRRCIAYVIYMAFSCKKKPSSSSTSEPGPSHTPPPQSPPTTSPTMCQYSEPGPSHIPPPSSPPRECSSLECTQPTTHPLTEQALAHFNEQEALGREDDILQTSPTMDQEMERDIPTQPMASSPTARSYRGNNRQTRSYQTSASRRSSRRRRVRFQQDSQSSLMLQRYRFNG